MTAGSKLLLSTSMVRPSSAFVEWLAWHRMIGAERVTVLIDRKQATGQPLLAALEAAGVVRIVPVNVDPDMKEEMHNSALLAGGIEGGESGGYGLFLGPDEYFRIHSTAQSIQTLMRGAGGADVLSVPVCEAGTGGHEHHAPGPVLHMARPVGAPGAGTPLRSVVRLGLFASRTPEVPVGPVAGDGPVRWVDGDGAPLPAPQSRVAWARAEHGLAMARASVLRIAAPASETLLLRAQHLPQKQQPGPEALLARLADLAAIDGPGHDVGARAAALDARIAELMALPGVAEAQAALEAWERATLRRILPEAEAEAVAERPARKAEAVAGTQDGTQAETQAQTQDETRTSADAQAGPGLPAWLAE